MTVRIGERVRLVADACEDGDRPNWGLAGDTGTVTMTDHTYGTVRVWLDRNGEEWWQEAGNIELLNHDDDALAMALELAQVIDDDMLPVTHQVLGYNAELESSIFVWDWLREEVRNALLERAR
jgi:hypothetical protein